MGSGDRVCAPHRRSALDRIIAGDLPGPADAATIERLDMLRPHLARTAVLAARLHLERAQAASQMLAALGLAALVLDETGKVLAANALIEGLVNFVHWRSADRMALNEKRATRCSVRRWSGSG